VLGPWEGPVARDRGVGERGVLQQAQPRHRADPVLRLRPAGSLAELALGGRECDDGRGADAAVLVAEDGPVGRRHDSGLRAEVDADDHLSSGDRRLSARGRLIQRIFLLVWDLRRYPSLLFGQ